MINLINKFTGLKKIVSCFSAAAIAAAIAPIVSMGAVTEYYFENFETLAVNDEQNDGNHIVRGDTAAEEWSISAADSVYRLWIGNDGTVNNGTKSLRLASSDQTSQDKGNAAVNLDFTKISSLDGHLSEDVAVEFDFGSYNIDYRGSGYISILNSSGRKIASILIHNDWKDDAGNYNTQMYLVTQNLAGDTTEQVPVGEPVHGQSRTIPIKKFKFTFNMADNIFKLSVDGEPIMSTVHGEWFPAGNAGSPWGGSISDNSEIGEITGITTGHNYAWWWGSTYLDNVRVASVEPEFGIKPVRVVNQDGRIRIRNGDTVSADITAVSGFTAAEPINEWSYSTDGGTSWMPMSGNVVPDGADKILLNVTVSTFDGQYTTESSIIRDISGSYIDFESLLRLELSSEETLNDINAARNGWAVEGDDYNLTVNSEGLTFESPNYYKNNRLTLDMASASGQEQPNVVRLTFDWMFATEEDEDQLVDDMKGYLSVKDDDGTAFCTLMFEKSNGYLVAYDENVGTNVAFLLYDQYAAVEGADTSRVTFGISRTVELIADFTQNRYSLTIDGVLMETSAGGWIPASSGREPGAGGAKDISKLRYIELGHTYSSWREKITINNLTLEGVDISQSEFDILDVSAANAADSELPLVNGAIVDADVEVSGAALADASYSLRARTGSGAWSAVTGNKIPENVTGLEVAADATSIFGQHAAKTAVFTVQGNTPPVFDEIALEGFAVKGTQLNLNYDINHAKPETCTVNVEWSKAKDLEREFTAISGVSGTDITVPDDCDGYFIKAKVTATDEFGASGQPIEIIAAPSVRGAIEAALGMLEVPVENDTFALSANDSENPMVFGVDYTWATSDASLLSISNGTATVIRPSGYGVFYANLTVTAEKDGITVQEVFRKKIIGLSGESKPSMGGTGGGSRGGSSSGSVTGSVAASSSAGENTVIEPPVTQEVSFSDVEQGSWYYDYVQNLADKKIISPAEYYRPDDFMTRAEFVKMIVEAYNIADVLDETEAQPREFNDVSESDWFYQYVDAACKAGVINGVDEDMFSPDGRISRQDMSVIICRALEFIGTPMEEGDADFTDSGAIAEYALESVGSMKSSGILSGYEDGSFKPQGNATRAEVAKVISMLTNDTAESE